MLQSQLEATRAEAGAARAALAAQLAELQVQKDAAAAGMEATKAQVIDLQGLLTAAQAAAQAVLGDAEKRGKQEAAALREAHAKELQALTAQLQASQQAAAEAQKVGAAFRLLFGGAVPGLGTSEVCRSTTYPVANPMKHTNQAHFMRPRAACPPGCCRRRHPGAGPFW